MMCYFYFLGIASKVHPYIQGKITHLRDPIRPEEKLSITLKCLAIGES